MSRILENSKHFYDTAVNTYGVFGEQSVLPYYNLANAVGLLMQHLCLKYGNGELSEQPTIAYLNEKLNTYGFSFVLPVKCESWPEIMDTWLRQVWEPGVIETGGLAFDDGISVYKAIVDSSTVYRNRNWQETLFNRAKFMRQESHRLFYDVETVGGVAGDFARKYASDSLSLLMDITATKYGVVFDPDISPVLKSERLKIIIGSEMSRRLRTCTMHTCGWDSPISKLDIDVPTAEIITEVWDRFDELLAFYTIGSVKSDG